MTNDSAPVVVEKTYPFPPATIWSALTEPDKMKKWYFDIPGFRPEVGYTFHFSGGAEDKIYVHECVVTEVIPGRKLTHSWRYKDYPGNSAVSFDLLPSGDGTRVTVTHSGIDSFPSDDKNFSRGSFTAGWNYILGESLDKYLRSA